MAIKTLRVCDMKPHCPNFLEVLSCSICNRDYCPTHAGGSLSIQATAAVTFGYVELLTLCASCRELSRMLQDEDGDPRDILRSIAEPIIEAFKAALAAHALAEDKKSKKQ